MFQDIMKKITEEINNSLNNYLDSGEDEEKLFLALQTIIQPKDTIISTKDTIVMSIPEGEILIFGCHKVILVDFNNSDNKLMSLDNLIESYLENYSEKEIEKIWFTIM